VKKQTADFSPPLPVLGLCGLAAAKPRKAAQVGVHTHNGASDEAEMVDGGGGAFRAFAGRV
jgi:hypothetical protein